MITLISQIIANFLNLAEEFFHYIFDGVRFSVLWDWLPSDIQIAAASIIVVLFAIALIKGVRSFLPF